MGALHRRPLSLAGSSSGTGSMACSPPLLPVSNPGALRKTQSLCLGHGQLPGAASYPQIHKALHRQPSALRSGSYPRAPGPHLLSGASHCPLPCAHPLTFSQQCGNLLNPSHLFQKLPRSQFAFAPGCLSFCKVRCSACVTHAVSPFTVI